ncbi:hypothetical protein BMIN_0668 [Bifidobacterium minimum]|uniref:Uncharacterized protein n=1 Tax=Bifidobacterium minimum TaxID=1693 RepID=A0A087BQC1_9BIFI|nr:hypothetical protein BMIN_0668 [Bifidobacterium minimum]
MSGPDPHRHRPLRKAGGETASCGIADQTMPGDVTGSFLAVRTLNPGIPGIVSAKSRIPIIA